MQFNSSFVTFLYLIMSTTAVHGAGTFTRPKHVSKGTGITTPPLINRAQKTAAISRFLTQKQLFDQGALLARLQIEGFMNNEGLKLSADECLKALVATLPIFQSQLFKSTAPLEKHHLLSFVRTVIEKRIAQNLNKPTHLIFTQDEIKKRTAQYRLS